MSEDRGEGRGGRREQPDSVRPADPNIRQAIGRFLGEQEERLSARTFARYRRAIETLRECLEALGRFHLEGEDGRSDPMVRGAGPPPGGYCDIHGPEHILPFYGEFRGRFLPCRRGLPKGVRDTVPAVLKSLARWLAREGHVEPGEAEYWIRRGAEAVRDLPEAEALAPILASLTPDRDDRSRDRRNETRRGRRTEERAVVQDCFRIGRILDGRLWLRRCGGEDVGPLTLPEDVVHRLRPGWRLEAAVEKQEEGWRLLEFRALFPA